MSRKKIWLYTLILCIAFTGTLLAVAPPLAMAPMAFTVIYMTTLAGSFLLAWAFEGVRYSRPLIMLATCASLGIFLGVGGTPIGAAVAILLTAVVYSVHKRTNRKPLAPVTTAEPAPVYPTAFGYKLSYEQAARQQ